jgi:hypothetical protein
MDLIHVVEANKEKSMLALTITTNNFPTDRNNPADKIKSVGLFLSVAALFWLTVLLPSAAYSQNKPASVHEIAPFLGFYAPDRFETSLAVGVRYHYHIDQRYSVGVIIGFASSKQDFVRRTNGLNLLPGSSRVFYHGARATHTFLKGKVEPYALLHLGLTRLYDENSFTYGLGVGTKVSINPKISFRYEFINYIFASGRDLNTWTNKNIEVALGFGYTL